MLSISRRIIINLSAIHYNFASTVYEDPTPISQLLRYQIKPSVPEIIKQELKLTEKAVEVLNSRPWILKDNKNTIENIFNRIADSIRYYQNLFDFLSRYNKRERSWKISKECSNQLCNAIEKAIIREMRAKKLSIGEICDLTRAHFNNRSSLEYPSEYFNCLLECYENLTEQQITALLEVFSTNSQFNSLSVQKWLLEYLKAKSSQFSQRNPYLLYLMCSFKFQVCYPDFAEPEFLTVALKRFETHDGLTLRQKIDIFRAYERNYIYDFESEIKLKDLYAEIAHNINPFTNSEADFKDLLGSLVLLVPYMAFPLDSLILKFTKVTKNKTSETIYWRSVMDILNITTFHHFDASTLNEFCCAILLELEDSKTRIRELLRPIEFLCKVGFDKDRLKRLIIKFTKVPQLLSSVEIIRLYGCKLYLKFEQHLGIEQAFQKQYSENPAKIVQSLNRTFLHKKQNQPTIAIITRLLADSHIPYFQVVHSLYSTYDIEQIHAIWFASAKLRILCEDQSFIVVCFHYPVGQRYIIHPYHFDLLKRLYQMIPPRYKFKTTINSMIWNIFKQNRLNIEFIETDKPGLLWWMQFLLIDFIAKNLRQLSHVLKRIFKLVCFKYQNDIEIEQFLVYAYTCLCVHKTNNQLNYFFILNFYHIIESKLTEKLLQAFLEYSPSNELSLPILRRRICVINKLIEKNSQHANRLNALSETIKYKPQFKFLIYAIYDFKNVPDLKKEELMILLDPYMPHPNIVLLFDQLHKHSLNKTEFIQIAKTVVKLPTAYRINYLIQNLNTVYDTMNEREKVKTVVLFATVKIRLDEMIHKVLQQSDSLLVLNILFDMGYTEVQEYFKKVIKRLDSFLNYCTPGTRFKILITVLAILPKTADNRNIVESIVSNLGDLKAKQPISQRQMQRYSLLIDICNFSYQNITTPIHDPAKDNFLKTITKSQLILSQQSGLTAYLTKQAFTITTIQKDLQLFTNETKILLLVGRQYLLLEPVDHTGDINLLIEYIGQLSKKKKKVVAVPINKKTTIDEMLIKIEK